MLIVSSIQTTVNNGVVDFSQLFKYWDVSAEYNCYDTWWY